MSHPPPHRIERTRNKHSRAMYRDDTVIIRLARNLSTREEQEHIDYLLKRMAKTVVREQQRERIDPFRPLLQGASQCTVALASGKQYEFSLSPATKNRSRRTESGWHVEVSPRIRRATLHRHFWKLLAHSEEASVEALVHAINDQTFRFRLRSVRVSFASSQWGSCSHRGDIMLNASLLLVPTPLLHYVIVHELAHRQYRNHSARYWKLVESVMPDYKERRKELRKYRICTL